MAAEIDVKYEEIEVHLKEKFVQAIQINDISFVRKFIYDNPQIVFPESIFRFCLSCDRIKIFKYLMKTSSFGLLDRSDKNQISYKIIRIKRGNISHLIYLALKAGADPNGIGTCKENDIISVIAQYSNTETFKHYLNDFNFDQLRSILIDYCSSGKVKCIKIIIGRIQNKFPDRLSDILGGYYLNSLTATIAASGNYRIINLFLPLGFDINLVENLGRGIVYYGVHFHNLAFLKGVLKLGADPNIQDNMGNTALHEAARKGYINVVKLLLDYGADPEIANEDGETPMTVDHVHRRSLTLKILNNYPKVVSLRTLCLRVVQKEKLDKTGLPPSIFIWPQEINN